MILFLNGEFVPEEDAVISVFDRGFMYGDGLFETLAVSGAAPRHWKEHWARFASGAALLDIEIPFDEPRARGFAEELIRLNSLPDSLLRITLSRGRGTRGYSPKAARQPTFAMWLYPAPQVPADAPLQWRLHVASQRLMANSPLASYKTCNKLPQILAKAEAEIAHADEAILCNTDGYVAEGASSNLFWVSNNEIFTPPLFSGGLSGVTRAIVFTLAEAEGFKVREAEIKPDELRQMDGVFLTLASLGIVEAIVLDNHPLATSPITRELYRRYLADH